MSGPGDCTTFKLRDIPAHFYPITVSFSCGSTGTCLHMQVIHCPDEAVTIPYFEGPLMLRMDYPDGATYERPI